MQVLYGLMLALVRLERGRRRDGLQHCHWWGG